MAEHGSIFKNNLNTYSPLFFSYPKQVRIPSNIGVMFMVSSIRTSTLIQERLERTETNVMDFKCDLNARKPA